MIKALALLSIIALLPRAALASLEIGEPLIRNFEPGEYGGHLQVWAVTQDKRGVMYFGMMGEIIQFDGTYWKSIELANRMTVRSLATDSDGVVYVGGVSEFGYLASNQEGQLSYQSLKGQIPLESRPFKDVWRLFTTSHGVYFITIDQVFRWHENRVTVFSLGTQVATKISDNLYIHTQNGIAEISKDGLSHLPNSAFKEETYGTIHLFPFPTNDRILVYSSNKGLFLVPLDHEGDAPQTGKKIPFQNEANDYLIHNKSSKATLLPQNLIAFGTDKGGVVIMDVNGKLIGVVNENRGLRANSILCIFKDRFHNLWVGMQGGIAHIEVSSPLTLFGKRSGLPSTVLSVTRHQHHIYAATWKDGPLKLPAYELSSENDAHRFAALKGDKVLTGWCFVNIGSTLLISAHKVRRIDNGEISTIEETPNGYGMRVSKRYLGRIYLGVSGMDDGGVGVIEYKTSISQDRTQSEVTQFEYKGKIPGISETVRSIIEDDQGNLWLSTRSSGILHLRFKSDVISDYEVEKYTTKHGLPSMEWNRAYLEGDQVWVATEKGIYKYVEHAPGQDKNIRFIPEFSTEKDNSEDEQGVDEITGYGNNRWLLSPFSDHGILTKASDGTYKADNRPFRAVSELQMYGPHIDPDGVVWFPMANGLYRYDPKKVKDYEAPYSALIRKVTTSSNRHIFEGTHYDPVSKTGDLYDRLGHVQPADQIHTLNYDENGLTFEYSALFYEQIEKTAYQIMLAGYDKTWSHWSDKTLKEYTNIPEGAYAFKVRAKNIYDTISKVAMYRFRILPPWYRTIWAYTGYLLGFLLLLFVLIRLNTSRLRAAKKRLEQIVKERTAEVVSQKNEIESQKNALEVAYKEVNETKDALWGEMELAKKIQTILLPEDPRIPGYEITGYMKTADEVGGDYYDIVNVRDKHWLVIGDVSGHGVPAGLVMMMVHSTIDHAIRSNLSDAPDKILSSVNQTIYRDIKKLGESKYMTLTLMSFGPDGTIYYAGLHQDIYIFRKARGEVEAIETQGIWLGIIADIEGMNTVDQLHLDPGDTMLLFTDGIVEATDQDGQMYDNEQLISVLERCGEQSTPEIRDRILQSLIGYTTDDDVTMMVVQRCDVS
ncbi:MAG: SpoIIE family protein phosphatase [Myxococcota bacterium]|nr:SpoIIE family protein phosphatase [Myxococcota bacterium]